VPSSFQKTSAVRSPLRGIFTRPVAAPHAATSAKLGRLTAGADPRRQGSASSARHAHPSCAPRAGSRRWCHSKPALTERCTVRSVTATVARMARTHDARQQTSGRYASRASADRRLHHDLSPARDNGSAGVAFADRGAQASVQRKRRFGCTRGHAAARANRDPQRATAAEEGLASAEDNS